MRVGSPNVSRSARRITGQISCWIAFLTSVIPQISSASAAGFSFTLPPDYAAVSSTHRNHVFYVGDAVAFTLSRSASRFEVRDYFGNVTVSGVPTANNQILLPSLVAPGWYKLYVYGARDQGDPWQDSVGGTTFVIFRNNPDFPPLPSPATGGGVDASEDQVIRSVTGMGPQRFYVDDAAQPAAAIAHLQADIDGDKTGYLPFDPLRKRALLVAFRNGIQSADGSKIAGLKQIVAHFQQDVQYWEGRNEPDQTLSAADAALKEQIPFYNAVKSVNPALKVLGPATTSTKNTAWLNSFLTLAKGSVDVFSFHAYNSVNGNLWLARQSLLDLQSLLQANGLTSVEKWQTEQGYFAAVYGVYQPRLEGRWTMLQMMVYEQFGIAKEHNHLWYDKSHGFWDVPAWWENEDGGLNPVAALMRVWSEELFGTTFSRALSFGTVDDGNYLGSLFTGPGKQIAAFMTGGSPQGVATLRVTGATPTLRTVSPFGVVSQIPVIGGLAQLPISELPSYVELAEGQSCDVVPRTYGTNVARSSGVSFLINGAAGDATTSRINNGIPDVWHYTLSDASAPWRVAAQPLPFTVEIDLPTASTLSDAIIYSGVPWQLDGTLLNYDLQAWVGGGWKTLDHVSEPTNTLKVFSPPVRCTVDSFFSDRCVFEHHFAPVTTTRVRLVINEVTYGGGATADVLAAGGQAGPQVVELREVALYQAPPLTLAAAPSDLHPLPGASVTLAVATGSNAPLRYQWLHNGTPIPGATASTLSISNVNLDAQGGYAVAVTDGISTVTSAAASVVLDTPFNHWAAQLFTTEQILRPRELLTQTPGAGLTNLESYFFLLNPWTGLGVVDAGSLPKLSLDREGSPPQFTLTFAGNPQASDVTWLVEGTSAPGVAPWVPLNPISTVVSPADTVTGRAPYQLKFNLPDAQSELVRLRLTVP